MAPRTNNSITVNKDKIRYELSRNKMTSASLSLAIGRSRSYVDQLLNGNMLSTDKATTIAIAHILGVDTEDIIAKPCEASNSGVNRGDNGLDNKILTDILMELKQVNKTLHELMDIKDDLNQIRVYESQIGARVKRIRDEICPKPVQDQGVRQ